MLLVGMLRVVLKGSVAVIVVSVLTTGGCRQHVTALLLAITYNDRTRVRENSTVGDGFIVDIAQACAVLPGLSRSGSTIATGLLLGDKKEKLAQFSFLMVIPPILGEALLDLIKMLKGSGAADAAANDVSTFPLIIGFLAAFISGCFACRLMINIVKKGKLIYFAIYCAIVGIITLIYSFFA